MPLFSRLLYRRNIILSRTLPRHVSANGLARAVTVVKRVRPAFLQFLERECPKNADPDLSLTSEAADGGDRIKPRA